MYQRRLVRLNCLGRMGLVGLLHRQCLTMRDSDADGSGAVTLANSDAEDVANSGELVHDLWSKTLELAVGMYLLARQVGWVCVLPLLVVIAVSRAVEKITDNVAERQMDFTQATQERVSLTRAVLDAVKTVRMMGAVDRIHAKIRDARDREMGAYVRFYRLMVAFFVSCKFPLLSPFYLSS
jgi:ATP-binding cassette, subfamily C (CFTR/MRP), member 1